MPGLRAAKSVLAFLTVNSSLASCAAGNKERQPET
jgi:hypothetical protein